ncbi:hypothetical protein ACSFBM_21415 [Variovorax sp. GB1R11]
MTICPSAFLIGALKALTAIWWIGEGVEPMARASRWLRVSMIVASKAARRSAMLL